jgi:hypothetical protein
MTEDDHVGRQHTAQIRREGFAPLPPFAVSQPMFLWHVGILTENRRQVNRICAGYLSAVI